MTIELLVEKLEQAKLSWMQEEKIKIEFIDICIDIGKQAIARAESTLEAEKERSSVKQSEPPTLQELKDTLRATGQLTNAQSWIVAEAVLKLLTAHASKEL